MPPWRPVLYRPPLDGTRVISLGDAPRGKLPSGGIERVSGRQALNADVYERLGWGLERYVWKGNWAKADCPLFRRSALRSH